MFLEDAWINGEVDKWEKIDRDRWMDGNMERIA